MTSDENYYSCRQPQLKDKFLFESYDRNEHPDDLPGATISSNKNRSLEDDPISNVFESP